MKSIDDRLTEVVQEALSLVGVTRANAVNDGLEEADERSVGVHRPLIDALRETERVDEEAIVGVQVHIDKIEFCLTTAKAEYV